MFALLHIVVLHKSSKRDKEYRNVLILEITGMNIIFSPPETSLQNCEH